MISEEKAAEIWAKVRKFWFYARLPKPRLIENPQADDPSIPIIAQYFLKEEDASPEFLSYWDNQLFLNVPQTIKDLGIKNEEELEKAVEALELHGTGHYSMISYDLLTKLLLCHNSVKALKTQGVADGEQAQEIGANLTNIFEDIIDNTYIVSHGVEKGMPDNKENICFIYDRFKERREHDPEIKKLPRKSWDVYMRVCEKLWDEEGRWVNKKKFSEEQEKAADRIFTLLKDDMYNSRNWEKKVSRFTQILAPFVKEDGQQGKDLKMFEGESSGDAKSLKMMIKQLQGMKKGRKGKKDKDGKGNKGKDKKDSKEKGLEQKIKQAEQDLENKIKGLARKMDKNSRDLIDDYKNLMIGSGICDSEEKANKWLYRDLASGYSVKFRPIHTAAGRAHPFTPKRWGPSDPIHELDLQYTLQTEGKAIPGVTTTKWRYRQTIGFKEGEQPPDLYMILDSSGSMTNPNNAIAPANLAAIAAAHSARNTGAKVAVKNFSGREDGTLRRDTSTLDETEDIDEIDDMLLLYKGGGTVLPQEDLLTWIKYPDKPKQFLLITDTQFHNFEEAFPYLKQVLEINDKNRGAIFCIGDGNSDNVKRLENIGWEVFYVHSQEDLFDLVVGKAKEVYEGVDDII